jgi:cytochrome b involved in lipid metabolism
MRSKFGLPRITLEELSLHNTEGDCWTAYQGKVYNITDYLHYHPGGVKKLMLGAGKDCTELFDRYHRWVNCDAFLGKFCVGILSDRPAVIAEVESGIDGLSDDDSYDALDKAASTTTKGKSALEDPDQDDV